MWYLPTKKKNPQHYQCGKPPDRLPVSFVSHNRKGLRLQISLAHSGEYYQPHGSGLRFGAGILLVFSSLVEMYSLTVTMPGDQRQREVIYCRLRCNSKHISGGLTPR